MTDIQMTQRTAMLKMWGLSHSPDFINEQSIAQFVIAERGLKTGDIFTLLNVLTPTKRDELLLEHEKLDVNVRRQFANYVFEQEPDNRVIQEAKNRVMAAVINKPYISSLSDFEELELILSEGFKENEPLRKECKRRGCLPFFNESTNVAFLAFSALEDLQGYKTMGPQTDSLLRDWVNEKFEGNVFFCLTETDTVVHELGEKRFVGDDEEIGSLVLNERDLRQNAAAKNWVQIFNEAIKLGTSDIHCEPSIKPGDDSVTIKMRVDGNLKTVSSKSTLKFKSADFKAMISYLTSRTGAVEHGSKIFKPESGCIFDYVKQTGVGKIKMRPEFLPTGILDNSGDDIVGCVLRVWKLSQNVATLEQLKVSPLLLPYLHSALRSKDGLVLVVGPTGSGKSTLMLAMLELLGRLTKGNKSIASFEDPIEQQLDGIKQIQLTDRIRRMIESGEVKEEIAREKVLRSFLRQDIDMAFIGEIRDAMTAIFAGDIANSGHKTFGTFHANSPESALVRLAGKFNGNRSHEIQFFSALSHIINVQLISGSCPSCRTVSTIDPMHVKRIVERYEFSKDQEAQLSNIKVSYNTGLKSNGALCVSCDGEGISGRHSYGGVFVIDKNTRKILLASQDDTRFITATESASVDINDDLLRLITDGSVSVDKLLDGETEITPTENTQLQVIA